ncbi:hypothetical protein EV379_2854 [Microterricola gilva]|uniref:Uncharacterized protein n=1 Tax=Microterricola gilva TaxID=393267 RepID=A0A4V2GB24_9MICO|nr:hypothetical protein [Microterricola gilva]RZU66496.1 hypothetical protein EV379_2854 [Microterricola gilva]
MRRFANALGLLLADAYLRNDGHSPAAHPPDMYRSPVMHGITWIR